VILTDVSHIDDRKRAANSCVRRGSARQTTRSPKASQSGFSQMKAVSTTFDVSAGSAVTPQDGQMGAR